MASVLRPVPPRREKKVTRRAPLPRLMGRSTGGVAGSLAGGVPRAAKSSMTAACAAVPGAGSASSPEVGVASSHLVIPRRGRIQKRPAKIAQSSAGRPSTLSHPSAAAATTSKPAIGSTNAGGSGERTSEYAASAQAMTTATCPAPSPNAIVSGLSKPSVNSI